MDTRDVAQLISGGASPWIIRHPSYNSSPFDAMMGYGLMR